MRHLGIVLAAGASTRMGRPKALLPAGGLPLARRQYELLLAGGCERAVIVLGADAERIGPAISGCRLVLNPDWPTGRFSSIRAGLLAQPDFDGYFILPVDTVGVSAETIRRVLRHAGQSASPLLRPVHGGQDGKALWLSHQAAKELCGLSITDRRVDDLIREKAERFPVEDPALLNNINTPEAWQATAARMGWPETRRA